MDRISFRHLGISALVKLGFVANVAIWLPLSSLFGSAALIGYNTVRLKGVPVHGFSGLLLSLLFGLIATIIGTLLFVSGGKIASLFAERFSSVRLKAPAEADE
jgi:hypothetical protein